MTPTPTPTPEPTPTPVVTPTPVPSPASINGYLRRNPDAAPDSTFEGFSYWLSKLEQFDGNYVEAEMVKAFIDSIEYNKRFRL